MKVFRGNNKTFIFRRRDRKKEIITDPPDKVWVTVKRGLKDKDFVFQKTYTSTEEENPILFDQNTGSFIVSFTSDDTDVYAGTYWLDIKIRIGKKETTILKPTRLEILPAVTWGQNEDDFIEKVSNPEPKKGGGS